MNKFENVQVGDKVFVDATRYYEINRNVYAVERVTKTQFAAGGRNFKRDNGRRIGDSAWVNVFAQRYDPAQHDKLIAQRDRKFKIERIKDIEKLNLTDAQLDAIIAILDAVPHEVTT